MFSSRFAARGLVIVELFGVGLLMVSLLVSASRGAELSNRTLFGNSAVQKELRLSDEQRQQVAAIVNEIEEQIASQMKTAVKDKKEISTNLEEQITNTVLAKQGPRLMTLLDQQQALRDWQIVVQSSGSGLFNNNRMRRFLNFTDEQLKQMAAIQDEMFNEVTRLALDIKLDVKVVQQKADQAKQTCFTKQLGVLTAKQKTTLDELLGKPFDLEQLKQTTSEK